MNFDNMTTTYSPNVTWANVSDFVTTATTEPSTSRPDLSEYLLTVREMHIIGYIYVVTSSLSILGSASIIVTSMIKRRLFMSEVHPIFQLSLGDFLASAMLLINVVLYFTDNNLINVCPWLSSFTMAMYTTTFLLTMMYAIEVLRRMKLRLNNIFSAPSVTPLTCTKRMVAAYSFAWTVPVVVVLLLNLSISTPTLPWRLLPEGYMCSNCLPMFHYNEDACWVSDSKDKMKNIVGKYLFLLPLICVILCNFVLYVITLSVYRKTQVTRGVLGYHQYKQESRIRNKAVLYQTVFFVCWLPSLLLGFISLTTVFNMRQFFPLYVIQACTSPLQGFLNCIIYGWKRKGFVQALSETTPLKNSNLPSYSSCSL